MGFFFGKQIYTMHSTVVYTPVHRHQLNKWRVTESIWTLNSSTLKYGVRAARCRLGRYSFTVIIEHHLFVFFTPFTRRGGVGGQK